LPRAFPLRALFRGSGCLCLALALWFFRPTSLGATFEPIDLGETWAEENFLVISMVEFHGRLYAGTQRKRDLERDPPVSGGLQVLCIYREEEVWRWHEACPTGFESGADLGWQNFSVTGMHVFQDRLYVGTWNVHTGAQLWRTRAGVIHPLELDDWERVDPNTFSGFAVTSLITFQDELYAGIFTQGFPILMPACGLWRSPDGVTWRRASFTGFLDPLNSDATTLAVHDGSLYAGTENGYFYDTLRVGTGTEVWRSEGGGLSDMRFSWRQVNRDGFGRTGPNVFNRNTLMMISHEGFLYVGTDNRYTGAELWRYDGVGWEQVLFAGDPMRNTLSITYHSGVVYRGDLYICTTNPFTGGEVWRLQGDRWSRVNERGFGRGHGTAAAPVVYEDRLVVVGNGGAQGGRLYSVGPPATGDIDGDGVPDEIDNCPSLSNEHQDDDDQNGVGDDCQDDDGDGVPRQHDCDDLAPSVHPGASDPFVDGVDWDCDGNDKGFWEWDDDGVDSNGNMQDNCGTVPVEGPYHGLFAFFAPWVLVFLALARLRRQYG
jgi:hypothetical protein